MGKTLDLRKKRLEKVDAETDSVGISLGRRKTELIIPDEGEPKILCRECGLEFTAEEERKCPLTPPCRSSQTSLK